MPIELASTPLRNPLKSLCAVCRDACVNAHMQVIENKQISAPRQRGIYILRIYIIYPPLWGTGVV